MTKTVQKKRRPGPSILLPDFFQCTVAMVLMKENLRGRQHRLHGPFTLPPFAPDARLKYHCVPYVSSPDRVQSRSSQPGFSLTCRSRVLAYRCAGSAYRECTQVFGYSVFKVQERAFHLSIGHFSKSFKMFFDYY